MSKANKAKPLPGMKQIAIADLTVGQQCLFQLSHWSPVNLHHVKLEYIGSKYIVMYNIVREAEYCVGVEVYAEQGAGEPMFYVSEEL